MTKLGIPYVNPIKPEVRMFVTARNSDLTEGRGSTVFKEYFDDVHEAVEAAKGIDVMGTDGEVYEVITLVPDVKKKVWGRWWLPDDVGYYTGFAHDSEWFDPQLIAEKVRESPKFKEYLKLKSIYSRYEEQ